MIPLWLVPSFYGDIRLERISESSTRILVTKATVGEKEALSKLHAKAQKKGWKSSQSVGMTPFTEGETLLERPIDEVAPLLAKLLKPTRKLVTAVKFADGKIEELCAPLPATDAHPYREVATKPDEIKAVEEKQPDKKPEAATTVAAPVKGCPAPDFVSAELKARQVLEVFLSPEQVEDFRRHNRFITVGGTTGHRYMITSRHNRKALEKFERSLYDLDEETAYCTHDWSVPAAEEMLALHLLVQLPGWERELRFLDGRPQ